MERVDFFIAGVQKGGTTALDTFLRRHPGVQMAKRKEVHFFDEDGTPDVAKLHDQFDWSVSNVVRAEATPIYFYWPQSIERIAAYNPAAKIIILLRHPVFRAWSHWRMETARHTDTMPFSVAIREGRQRVSSAPGGVHRVFSYVERGFYASQTERLFKLFPHNQIHFLRTDNLWMEGAATLEVIAQFIGVTPRAICAEEYIVPMASWSDTAMSLSDRQYLDDLFTADICKTMALTGLDLLDWLDPNYEEPMNPIQHKL
jgi:hypothetical protein